MVTFLKIFFQSPERNFQLWSQNFFFAQVLWPFSFLDIYFCPFFKIGKYFWEFFFIFQNIYLTYLKKLLK